MPLVQIITILVVLVFAVYLFNLLALDVIALIINAAIIFFLISRLLKAIRKGLSDLCVASALLVLLVMILFRPPGFPVYRITWFLILAYLLSHAAYWAHCKGYFDLSGLVSSKKGR